MEIRRHRRLLFVRGNVSRNEPNFPQPESLGGGAGHIEMSAMNGIESTAKQSDIHSVRSYSFRFSPTARKYAPKHRWVRVPHASEASVGFLTLPFLRATAVPRVFSNY